MSETEAYDRVLSCVMNHPLNREALIEILRYCEQERDQADVEAHMQAPSAAYSALLSPYRLICQLVDAGGIVCTEVDADGEPVTDDRKAGLSEDELDDLVQSVGEFRKILLVEEYLVAVVTRCAVGGRDFAALGDGQEIVVAARGPDIEKIGPAARLYGFGKNLGFVILAFATEMGWG